MLKPRAVPTDWAARGASLLCHARLSKYADQARDMSALAIEWQRHALRAPSAVAVREAFLQAWRAEALAHLGAAELHAVAMQLYALSRCEQASPVEVQAALDACELAEGYARDASRALRLARAHWHGWIMRGRAREKGVAS